MAVKKKQTKKSKKNKVNKSRIMTIGLVYGLIIGVSVGYQLIQTLGIFALTFGIYAGLIYGLISGAAILRDAQS